MIQPGQTGTDRTSTGGTMPTNGTTDGPHTPAGAAELLVPLREPITRVPAVVNLVMDLLADLEGDGRLQTDEHELLADHMNPIVAAAEEAKVAATTLVDALERMHTDINTLTYNR
ncbi:hypothetical protein ACWD45_24755 [Streptomyces rubiginosohelvolus]